ncbi:hypothetical protein GCM10011614_34840 [Novosphingobium colocasiae]|uniref:Uncharacterized protein n=1 Tax=Novosphingobium colocasiae TaxID=1256513 RepID=A0A918UKX4_9SPHN|nr:hypothetical protein GCM10011614_34840 [Novosphingobium colocasiae]
MTINRDGWHRLGQFRGKHRIAAQCRRLFATLRDAAHDNILDRGGIDSRSVKQCVQALGSKIIGVPSGEFTISTTTGRAHSINNIGFRHSIDLPI